MLLFGAAGGIATGADGSGKHGVVLDRIRESARQWPAPEFRATIQSFFLPVAVIIISGHAVAGRITAEVGTLYLLCLPIITVAFLVGTPLNRRLKNSDRFLRYIYAMLIIIGASLMWRSVHGLMPDSSNDVSSRHPVVVDTVRPEGPLVPTESASRAVDLDDVVAGHADVAGNIRQVR